MIEISHRIVTVLGGKIEVESELGVGTTFRISLRIAKVDVMEKTAELVSSPASRRARVLVVDDEPMIGAVIKRSLGGEHEVVVMAEASEGLDCIRKGESFDVIICDLMMPHMTGMEFYSGVCDVDRAQADRILFLTGGAFTPAARSFLDGVSNQRIEKPFDTARLRSLVNERVA